MKKPVFITAGNSDALRYAKLWLTRWGYVPSDTPSQHATHLLLPIPSMESASTLKGGQPLADVLERLPQDITILGGNLPSLPYHSMDLLQDEGYLTENAAITARCAVKILQGHLATQDVKEKNILIIGWGRIGKQLAAMLKDMNANITVAIRKESDYEALSKNRTNAVYIRHWDLTKYDVIINTAPAPLLQASDANPSTLLMDLASIKGIEGDRVIWARGLPNKEAPEESGILIAKTALRFALGKENI